MLRCLLLMWVPWTAAASAGHDTSAFPLDLVVTALILVVARLGGHLATRASQPAVVGELLGGVALGALARGCGAEVGLLDRPAVQLLAELGVIVLLFEVGLESTVPQMLKVGASAALVAALGVVGPFLLGGLVSASLLPDAAVWVHVFLGAALTATSVGITARVLQDLGRSRSGEARVVLGAAVIDDVLGLVVLASVSGIIEAAAAGRPISAGPIVWIAAKALGFLVGGLGLGVMITPTAYRRASKLTGGSVLLTVSLAFCFSMAGAAGMAGLAPIVGAFAAGLVLEQGLYEDFVAKGERPLEQLVSPITSFLAPVFFVLMGLRVDLSVFLDLQVLALAAALLVAAVGGKQLSMLGVLDPKLSKLAVGIGMIPRGEVGLIFANMGLQITLDGAPLLDHRLYAALVVMVVATTLATPPLLAAAFSRIPPEGHEAG